MGIFEPFRAIGYTTSDVPFSVQRMGTETFVTVSVGKAWQIFNCAKLNLVLVGSQLQKKIRALASYHEFTFAAVGNDIAVFKRAHQVLTWCRHESKIKLLLLFGEHILSVDVAGNMFIWPIKGIGNMMDPDGHIIFQDKFTPTCLIHPDTYMNKVVVGTQEGKFELWNISTKKKIHAFKGWDLPICCCVSSPALDVIAFGCADGKVHLHNIRFDKEIVTFSHLARGAVSSLSFCTDGRPLLAAGGSSGMISIWNLEKRRLHSVIKEAHAGPVISLHFFANEPVLMSSAKDNAIKMWIFDNNDGDARLLRFRSGHSAPPVCMRFYANGKHILSAGYDRAFRLFSVIQDQQSRELSQRHTSNRAKKLKIKEEDVKLKPVISFDFSEIRERDWCNVVSCHMDTPRAYVWRLQNSVLGELVLKPSKQSPVKTCTVSVCGNFTIIGTEGGWVESFNLQSGISRGSFMDPDEGSKCAHSGEVAGIACNASNSLLISVGYRGDIKLWDFKRLAMKSRWEVGCCVARVVFQRTSGLLAVACDDFTIRLFDVVSERAVRRFEGHADRVTDMCFSEDGKWLLSSGMDGSVRTWDVVVGRQIDVMSVDVCVTALSLSPDMDLLATTHTGQNGIYLWANRAMFSAVAEKKNGPVVMPADEHWRGEEPGMITLSLLPKSQWQSLVQLDLIRERNRPIQPPSKPEPAPFFLPSVPTLSGEVEFRLADKQTVAERGVDAITPKSLTTETVLSELLRACAHLGDFSSFTDYIKGMSPAALDMELRLLLILNEDEETVKESPELGVLGLLLDYFVGQVSCGNEFEFVQAAVHVFLKIHGDAVRREESLLVKAQSLLDVQLTRWQSIDAMFQSSRCMLTFLTDSQF